MVGRGVGGGILGVGIEGVGWGWGRGGWDGALGMAGRVGGAGVMVKGGEVGVWEGEERSDGLSASMYMFKYVPR